MASKRERNKTKIRDMEGWTDEKYLKLFELVEAEPCLWNKYHPGHSKRDKTDAALRKVATTLGSTVHEVQTRWRSMRQTFFKYLNKEKQAKSGNEGGVVKKEWRFMKSLGFLKCEDTEAGGTGMEILKCELTELGDTGCLNNYDGEYINSENAISEPSTENIPKRAKTHSESFHMKAVYHKYLTELISNANDEFSEKGNEIGNALRRIAKKNPNMADELYISIRRMILDKEESLCRSVTSSIPSTSTF